MKLRSGRVSGDNDHINDDTSIKEEQRLRAPEHSREEFVKEETQYSANSPSPSTPDSRTIYTIGHGTRTLSELIDILESAGITTLVDVRSIPRSFTNPQFNHDTLVSSPELRDATIEYVWFGPKLGGRRNAKQPNVDKHTAIRVKSFQNYAGYMSTAAFKEGLQELEDMGLENTKEGQDSRTAYMCSETLWWRCHRRMISDTLVVHGWDVQHLGVGKGSSMKHRVWEIARKDKDGSLVYDISR